MYTTLEPNRGPSHVPGNAGAHSVLGSCGSPAAWDPATLCCRAAGHRRGRRGAAGPRASSFPVSFLALSRLSAEKPAWTLEVEESSVIALPVVAWGRGLRIQKLLAPFSLGVCLSVPAKPSKICLF